MKNNKRRLNSSYSVDDFENDKMISTYNNSINLKKSTLNSEKDKMEFVLPEPPCLQNE